MTTWTLENSGVEKSLAAWGLDDLDLTRVSWSDDTLNLLANGRLVDAAYLFPIKSEIIVRRYDDAVATIWFRGSVRRVQLAGSGPAESQQYAIVGPWWYLKERTFNQVFYTYKGSGDPADPANYNPQYLARIFLNQSVNLYGAAIGFLTTGEQLTEILNWVRKPYVDAGTTPPFQIGNIGIAVNAPVDEVKNITSAEAARKMFRWSPDSVAWFDYATTPPTFHCQPRAALTAKTIDLTKIRPVQVSVIPEHERVRTFVRLQYEISSSIAGVSYLATVVDTWPNPLPVTPEDAFHGIEQIIDLRGPTIKNISATVAVAAIDTASNDWWLDNLPSYRKAKDAGKITSFTVDQSTVAVVATGGEAYLDLPNQLLPSGSHLCKWMGVQQQRQKATAQLTIVFSDASTLTKSIAVPMMATDAVSKKYSKETERDFGDPQPQNLARQLYEANSFLHHKGSITFEKQEVGTVGGLGNTLNLTGMAAAWATMGAVIQQTSERARSGYTQLQFGWPEHLMAGDYIDLLRVARSRSIWSSFGSRLGDTATGMDIDVGVAQSEENAGTAENTGTAAGNSFKGLWNPAVTYHAGDEVIVQSGPACGTYICTTATSLNQSPAVIVGMNWPDTGNGWMQVAPGPLNGNWY